MDFALRYVLCSWIKAESIDDAGGSATVFKLVQQTPNKIEKSIHWIVANGFMAFRQFMRIGCVPATATATHTRGYLTSSWYEWMKAEHRNGCVVKHISLLREQWCEMVVIAAMCQLSLLCTFALHKDSDEIWISILILDDILIRFYAIVFQHTNLCTRRGSFVQQLNSFEKFIRAPNTVSTRKRDAMEHVHVGWRYHGVECWLHFRLFSFCCCCFCMKRWRINWRVGSGTQQVVIVWLHGCEMMTLTHIYRVYYIIYSIFGIGDVYASRLNKSLMM